MEIAGKTSIMSLNFDSRFKNNKNHGLGYSIGMGFYSGFNTKESDIFRIVFGALPININYLIGKKDHHLEFGVGLTTLLRQSEIKAPDFGIIKRSGDADYNGILRIGYRFQSMNKKPSFGVNINPILNKNGPNYNFGINLGYVI